MTGGITVKSVCLSLSFPTLIPAARWIEFFLKMHQLVVSFCVKNEVTEMIRISEFLVLYYKQGKKK
jgi:hypothetical protein